MNKKTVFNGEKNFKFKKVKTIKLLNRTKNFLNNQMKYSKGLDILQKTLFRISHEDIVISLSIKIREIFIRHFLIIISSIRKREKIDIIKKNLYHWRYINKNYKIKNNQIKTKLKIILLKKYNYDTKNLLKYFNIWKNSNKINKELYNQFNNILKYYCNKNYLDTKKIMINNLIDRYKNNQKEKLKINLRKMFIKYIFNKISHSLNELTININIKNLLIITKEIKYNAKIEFLIKIIRKWRFMTFVNNLVKKKLELIYNNMHISYVEMANEIFSTPEAISARELKNLYEFNELTELDFKTNSFFKKELGFNYDKFLNNNVK